jgi:autotransporter translocation and assembly factor TamB
MNLGKSLDDDVYLSYSRGLTDLTEEVWTLEWQISPAFSLIGDFSNNVGYEWQLLYRLMF